MRYPALMLTVLSLAGCSILEDEVARGYAQRDVLTAATFTTADIRMVTLRNRQGYPIICTEPSPDVAKALSAAVAASAQGGKGGSGSGGGASAEAVLGLAGRSTALLGLRDGLYRACEAYANGVIGADAYALVLSRYGQLMTTLFLGQDVTGAAGTAAGGSVQSPQVTVNLSGGPSVSAGQASSPPAGGAPATGAPTASVTDTSAVSLARMNEDYLNLGYNPDVLVIACINYKDSSRVPATTNPFLDGICPSLSSVYGLSRLTAVPIALVKNKVLASPVSPEAALQAVAAANKAAAATANKAAATNKSAGGGAPGTGGGKPGAGGGKPGAGGGTPGAGGGTPGAGGGTPGAGGGTPGAGGGTPGAGGGTPGAGGGTPGAGGGTPGAGGGTPGAGGGTPGASGEPTPLHTPRQ